MQNSLVFSLIFFLHKFHNLTVNFTSKILQVSETKKGTQKALKNLSDSVKFSEI